MTNRNTIKGVTISKIESLYEKYRYLLDKNWFHTITDNNIFEERMLELVVAKHMTALNNNKLEKYPEKQNCKAPDFLIKKSENTYALEVTSIRLPVTGSIIKNNIKKFNKNRRLSHKDYDRKALSNETKSRVTQAFMEKVNKYDKKTFENKSRA